MDSFKRNIIFFAIFSIIILYIIITPVAGNLVYVTIPFCLDELGQDGFNTKLDDTNENIRLHNNQRLQQERVEESIKTPCGKVYYKKLTSVGDSMFPMTFCSLLYGNVQLCLSEIREEGFKVYSGTDEKIRLKNYQLAHLPGAYQKLTTPHGKTYYNSLMNENDFIKTSEEFCQSLYEQLNSNLNHNDEWVNYRTEITTIRDISSCLVEIEQDGCYFDSDNDIDYKSLNTPHGKIYYEIFYINTERVNSIRDRTPNYFCSWIHTNNPQNNLWKKLKIKLNYEICVAHLVYDAYDIRKNTALNNLLRVTDVPGYYSYMESIGQAKIIKPIETQYGHDYRKHILESRAMQETNQNAFKFCKDHTISI